MFLNCLLIYLWNFAFCQSAVALWVTFEKPKPQALFKPLYIFSESKLFSINIWNMIKWVLVTGKNIRLELQTYLVTIFTSWGPCFQLIQLHIQWKRGVLISLQLTKLQQTDINLVPYLTCKGYWIRMKRSYSKWLGVKFAESVELQIILVAQWLVQLQLKLVA